jgi:MoxR-like ATPase
MNLPPELPTPPPFTPQPAPYAPPLPVAPTTDYSPPPPAPLSSPSQAILQAIHQSISQVFIGQHEVIYQVLAALLAGGHVLLEGKPGLGKTHLVLALARTFGGNFRRIQFTPDLMPSDVTGHTLFDLSSQTFRVRQGPIFTQLLLADEINRAPAKTQSALLEVMQEGQVTIDGESHSLTPPFMTFATQTPSSKKAPTRSPRPNWIASW